MKSFNTMTTGALPVLAILCAAPASANLLINGDFESGNTGFTTAFTYSETSIVPAQTYSIVNDPRTVHGSAQSYNDHTLDPGSQMMAINGTSSSTDKVIWSQTVDVAAGVDYEFGLWTSSWSTGGQLRIAINGETLGAEFISPIPRGTWEQTTRDWNSGTATSAQIDIFNTSSTFSGNDFAIDDLTFVAVPEPSSLLLLSGFSAAVFVRRRRHA